MDVLKFTDWNNISLTEEFLKKIGESFLLESDNNKVSKEHSLKSTIRILKLKSKVYNQFKPFINSVFSLIEMLLSNSDMSVEINNDTISVVSLATLSITYLEEGKTKMNAEEYELLKAESKSILEECKLKGVGNGIIKKLVTCLISIGKLFNIILNKMGHKSNGFFTILSYSKLIEPTIISINHIVKKYKIDINYLPNKLSVIIDNITSSDGKNNMSEFLKKIKNSFNSDVPDKTLIDKGATELITED